MKTITLSLILLAAPALAGELYQHINTGPLDIYVDDYAVHEPAIPIPAAPRYYVKVSIGTTDPDISILIVSLRVLLDDGTTGSARFLLERSGQYVEEKQELRCRPVKLKAIYITRFQRGTTEIVQGVR